MQISVMIWIAALTAIRVVAIACQASVRALRTDSIRDMFVDVWRIRAV